MAKLIIRSMIFGLILGTLFFVISPLGLGSYFIEYLRPILIPGVLLTQIFLNVIGIIPLLLALFLNGMIYSILFFGFFATRIYRVNK